MKCVSASSFGVRVSLGLSGIGFQVSDRGFQVSGQVSVTTLQVVWVPLIEGFGFRGLAFGFRVSSFHFFGVEF